MQSQLIPLRNRQGLTVAFARIDIGDYEWLSQWRWSLGSDGHARRRLKQPKGKWRGVSMHRQILGLEYGDRRQCDHINFDPLDNRRCNLRIVTEAENRRHQRGRKGTSRYRGVHWAKEQCKWLARAKFDGKSHDLGAFDLEEAAAEAVRAWWAERGYTEWVRY